MDAIVLVVFGSPEAVLCPPRIDLTPAFPGYLPVNNDALEGLHTGLFEYQLLNFTPVAASESILGVLI